MNHNIPLVIAAAGMGSRALPHTEIIPKAMLSLNGKHLLDHVFDVGEQMNMKEVFVIVGHKAEVIKNYLGKHHRGMEVNYVFQDQLKGLVHAISKLEPVLNREFVMLLGDEVYINTDHHKLIPFFRENNPDGVCGIMKTDNPALIRKNYSVEMCPNNRITRLVEKPDTIVNQWMGSGTCVFKPHIFSYIEKTPINPKRNERELTDFIQVMINNGKVFLPFNLGGRYINVNFADDLKMISELLKTSTSKQSMINHI